MKEQKVVMVEMLQPEVDATLTPLLKAGWTIVSVNPSPAPLARRSVYGQDLDPVGVSMVLLERVHR